MVILPGASMLTDARRLTRALVVAVILMVSVAAYLWYQSVPHRVERFAFRPIPDTVVLADAAESEHFAVSGLVTLRRESTPGRRLVTFEVMISPREGRSVHDLLVTAELSERVAPYMDAPGLAFGQLAPTDLVPGEEPHTLIVSTTQSHPDPAQMTAGERRRYDEALRMPIDLGLWWRDGEEFLTLPPEAIEYVGFPEPPAP